MGRSLSTLLALLVSGLLPLGAQTRTHGPLVLQLPAGTRALGLGGAFAMGFRESDAVFYHPGLLDRATGFTASVQRYGSAATLTALSAAREWWSGGVAAGIQLLAYQVDPALPVEGEDVLALPRHASSLLQRGSVAASEAVLSLGYGRELRGLRLGAVGKIVEQRLGPLRATTAAVDLGAAAEVGPLTTGISVQNLGPAMRIGGARIPLAGRVLLGVSSPWAPVGPLDLSASTALGYVFDGEPVAAAGLEVAYWPVVGRTFVGRVGVRYTEDAAADGFTLGAAFHGDDIVVEYAYEGFGEAGRAHRITVGWR